MHGHPADNRFLPEYQDEGVRGVTLYRNATNNLLLQARIALKVFEEECGGDRSCAMNEWVDKKGVKGYGTENGPAFEFGKWVEKHFEGHGEGEASCTVDESDVERLTIELKEKFNPSVH